MNQMANMNMAMGGGGGAGGGMNPMNGMNAMGQMNHQMASAQQQQQQQQMNPMAKMQGMANGYPPRRMSPYPSPQMHVAQKRAMYPAMGHGGGGVGGVGGMGPGPPNPQSVPLGGGGGGGGIGPMQYSHHNQTNGVPVPMQQNYGRGGPISGYGRVPAAGPGMMPQQRQNTPPYQQTVAGPGGHPGQSQFYGSGYQNVQG